MLWGSARKTATPPAATGPAPAEDLTGKIIRCKDCDWATTPDKVADLDKHTRVRHGRPCGKIERTPIDAGAPR